MGGFLSLSLWANENNAISELLPPFHLQPMVRHVAVSVARWKLVLKIHTWQDVIYDRRAALICYPLGFSYV